MGNLTGGANAPTHGDRLSADLAEVRRNCQRFSTQGELRACDDTSGAGYVVHRVLTGWGEVIGVRLGHPDTWCPR